MDRHLFLRRHCSTQSIKFKPSIFKKTPSFRLEFQRISWYPFIWLHRIWFIINNKQKSKTLVLSIPMLHVYLTVFLKSKMIQVSCSYWWLYTKGGGRDAWISLKLTNQYVWWVWIRTLVLIVRATSHLFYNTYFVKNIG